MTWVSGTAPELGAEIRRLRDEAGWSRATLAEQTGVSQSTIVRLEVHGLIPTLSNFVALAAALGADLNELGEYVPVPA